MPGATTPSVQKKWTYAFVPGREPLCSKKPLRTCRAGPSHDPHLNGGSVGCCVVWTLFRAKARRDAVITKTDHDRDGELDPQKLRLPL
jgi:hypothetical protein